MKVNVTKDYSLFRVATTKKFPNREQHSEYHKALRAYMQRVGFLPQYPIVCVFDARTQKWIVRDGQHRLQAAVQTGAVQTAAPWQASARMSPWSRCRWWPPSPSRIWR